MAAWFADGRVVALVLVLTLCEGVGLTLLYRRTGRGIPPAALWPNLMAGGALALALLACVTGAAWFWMAAALLAALLAHLADLRVRWSQPGAGSAAASGGSLSSSRRP